MSFVSQVRWKYRELQRLYRLMFPEASARLMIKTAGGFWLWRHGAKRELKVSLWKTVTPGWYCLDIGFPRLKVGLEAKGGWRHYYEGDVARDQKLIDKGWRILRVTEAEMNEDPAGTRRRIRKFVKGK